MLIGPNVPLRLQRVTPTPTFASSMVHEFVYSFANRSPLPEFLFRYIYANHIFQTWRDCSIHPAVATLAALKRPGPWATRLTALIMVFRHGSIDM